MHISFSYAKILGETNFHTREIPRSGSKAKDGERKKRNYINIYHLVTNKSGSKAKDGKEREKKKKKERLKVGNNNGQLCIANATSCGACKAAWANIGMNTLLLSQCGMLGSNIN